MKKEMIIKDNILIEVDENDIKNGEIQLPNNITSIKNNAFKNVLDVIANNGIRIIIPDSVVSVGDGMQFDLKNRKIYFIPQENKKSIPGYFINILGGIDKTIVFFNNRSVSKHFFSNFSRDFNEFSKRPSIIEKRSILRFAKLLGCFSVIEWETGVLVCYKATSILSEILKAQEKAGIDLGEYSKIFDSIPIDTEIAIDFIKYLINQNKSDKFELLKKLLELENEKEFKGIFLKTILNFKDVLKNRNATDVDGKPVTLSIQDACIAFFRKNEIPYKNVLPENEDISKLYSSRGVREKVYEEAVALREEAIKSGVPEHLLGEPNKEQTIRERIEEIRRKTGDEIEDIKAQITAAYKIKFTYEWLSKRHAINGILGLYTNCCASLTRVLDSRNTAKASILAKDVQNLIIRDSNNNVIAKGTFYLNRELGYGVINSFAINSSVKKNNYESIMVAFMRGINSFVKKYDEKHPNNPIKQINTGISYNILEILINRFEKSPELLTVPSEYSFVDAAKQQYILYNRNDETSIDIGDK